MFQLNERKRSLRFEKRNWLWVLRFRGTERDRSSKDERGFCFVFGVRRVLTAARLGAAPKEKAGP